MQQLELEGIANAAYPSAGLDPERPNVVRLARALLGADAIQRGPRPLHGQAALVRVGDLWRIILGRSLLAVEARFAVAHELGHWLLARHGLDDRDEASADYLGGALLAPQRAFLAAHRALGSDLPALAAAFGTTETGSALRLGEVTHTPLAVVSPARVRVRGPDSWVWPDEATIRTWARRPRPWLRRTRLDGDPRRVVLKADEVDAAAR